MAYSFSAFVSSLLLQRYKNSIPKVTTPNSIHSHITGKGLRDERDGSFMMEKVYSSAVQRKTRKIMRATIRDIKKS